MHKNKHTLITGILILLAVIAACGDPVTRAEGVVRDEKGNALSGVKVVFETSVGENGEFRKKSEQVTGSDGVFDFGEITEPAKQVRLTFAKDQYQRVVRNVTPNRDNKFDVELKSIKSEKKAQEVTK